MVAVDTRFNQAQKYRLHNYLCFLTMKISQENLERVSFVFLQIFLILYNFLIIIFQNIDKAQFK